MRKTSVLERVRLFGRSPASAVDYARAFGFSAARAVWSVVRRGNGFLLVKQLHSVGVMSLAIIVVSVYRYGAVTAGLQYFGLNMALSRQWGRWLFDLAAWLGASGYSLVVCRARRVCVDRRDQQYKSTEQLSACDDRRGPR